MIRLHGSSASRTTFRHVPVLAALLTLATFAQAQPPEVLPTLAPMIERISPAVVNISVKGHVAADNPLAEDPFFRRFFELPEDREFQSAGSGVIVDASRGYILTNHHVVENAEQITVTLLDDRIMQAEVVGTDAPSDLAVLKVEASDLTQITFAESSRLRVGDYVVAIGNPFGFSHTVTSGIISGLGRTRVNPDPNAYEDFIQTDASINPGNSGGALVNLSGDLVGINSAIISRGGGNIGIGFAIPADMAFNVMEQLIDYGEVSRGMLGVTILSITPGVASTYGLSNTSGALVTDVSPDSAAETAGLKINDIIVSVNKRAVRDSGSLRSAIGLMRPGDRVEVGFIRDGREQTVSATLNALSAALVESAAPAPAPVAELDPVFDGVELVADQGPAGIDGLRVATLEAESLAADAGLREGDVITNINRQRVRSLDEARQITADARSIILQVRRGSRSLLILLR
jgi:Do/DeqQ family serine protease